MARFQGHRCFKHCSVWVTVTSTESSRKFTRKHVLGRQQGCGRIATNVTSKKGDWMSVLTGWCAHNREQQYLEFYCAQPNTLNQKYWGWPRRGSACPAGTDSRTIPNCLPFFAEATSILLPGILLQLWSHSPPFISSWPALSADPSVKYIMVKCHRNDLGPLLWESVGWQCSLTMAMLSMVTTNRLATELLLAKLKAIWVINPHPMSNRYTEYR